MLRRYLVKFNDGQACTVKELGIGSATLYRRLESYGLITDREPTPPAPGKPSQ